jgi:dTDP-glucose 4,6-dehydratase
MKNVLVTGGAGFIGSNFIRFLLNQEQIIHITNLDALTYAGSLENLKDVSSDKRYEFVQGNICDYPLCSQVIRDCDIDTVVHFAAESHVDRSIEGPAQFIETNITGTFTLLECVRSIWLNAKNCHLEGFRFHHISTDEVFGSLGQMDAPFHELTPYAPNSPYSASKAASDHLVRAYHKTYGLPVTISNASNNYGPFQLPEKLIPLVIFNALEEKPIPVYGDGMQIRDWIYVTDHCEAIWKILKNGKSGETYNIGGNNQPTNLEIIQIICKMMDEFQPEHAPHDRLIQFVKDRPGHDRRYAMNIQKISAELGWLPRESLQSGLRKTIEWYFQNHQWLQAIRDQNDYQRWVIQNYGKRGDKK